MTDPNVETAVQEVQPRDSRIARHSVSSGMRSLVAFAPQSPEEIVDSLLAELRAPLLKAVRGAQEVLGDEVRLQSWLAMQARFRLLRLADRFDQELAASANKNLGDPPSVGAPFSSLADAPLPSDEFFDLGSVVPAYERTSRPPPSPSRLPPPPEDF